MNWSAALGDGSIPILVGPTAVGKTAVAMALAERLPIEIISADSRQIYRRLDIGTAKPSPRELRRVKHHGVDLIAPGERYGAGRFAREAQGWLAAAAEAGKQAVIVGGTGLYIKALVDGLFLEPPLDPDRRRSLQTFVAGLGSTTLVRWASRLDRRFGGGGRQRAARSIEVALLSGRSLSYWQDHAKTEGAIDPWFVVLTVPRPVLHRRIAVRAEDMVRRGVIEEAAAVLADGVPPDAPGLDGVGIREAVEYLQGTRSRASVAEAITIATRQYAKRQETWFRHQLRGPVLTLDASGPPEQVADAVALAWRSRERTFV